MIAIQFVALVDRVAYECHVTRDEILSRAREPSVSDARAIAVYCARRLWRCSYPRLGELFGRSHMTALYLDRKTRDLLEYDRQVANIVQRVMQSEAA